MSYLDAVLWGLGLCLFGFGCFYLMAHLKEKVILGLRRYDPLRTQLERCCAILVLVGGVSSVVGVVVLLPILVPIAIVWAVGFVGLTLSKTAYYLAKRRWAHAHT